VTGELTPDEREAAVEELGDRARILVATDCLSEGVNLQSLFTAVVHYDLSWNPTRHEQREGRVDRFGQKAREVRSTMLYGEDNPVDGAVLQVILRKAESIRKELGVLVPMPDNEGKLTQALLNAVLLRKGAPLNALRRARPVRRARQGDRSSPGRAPGEGQAEPLIFAQRRLKPEDVLPEWRKSRRRPGRRGRCRALRQPRRQPSWVRRCSRPSSTSSCHRPPAAAAVQERLAADGMAGTLRIDFHQPAAQAPLHPPHAPAGRRAGRHAAGTGAGCHRPRCHDAAVARAGAAFVGAVSLKTTVLLLRMRHQLTVTHGTQPA
jgi:hypothetical protein